MARPPVILFTVVMAMIAIFLFSLSIYTDQVDLVNRDTQQDWNTLLESFSKLEFCVSGNESIAYNDPNDHAKNEAPPDHRRRNAIDTNNHVISVTTNVHVHLGNQPHQFISSNLVAHLSGRHFGNKASDWRERTNVNVTFHLPSLANLLSHCQGVQKQKRDKKDGTYNSLPCDEVTIPMCITFQSSAMIFPQTRLPKKCNLKEFPFPSRSAWSLHWHAAHSIFHAYHCRNDLYVRAVYELDPKLTLMLTQQDKSRIKINLQTCCLILLAFITSVLCYGSLYNTHYYRTLPSHSEEPEDNSYAYGSSRSISEVLNSEIEER